MKPRWVAPVLAAALVGLLAAPGAGGAPARMNVLWVISDDLNTRLGTYGDPLVKTPNLDRLASEGVKFSRAICQYPLCGPSRVSFLTGRRPDHTRVYNNEQEFRKRAPDVVTLPQAFQEVGYSVARVGKIFHYQVPRDIGTSGLDDPASWQKVVNPIGRDRTIDQDKIFCLLPHKLGGTLSWLAADGTDEEQTDGIGATEAIKLLEQNQAKPFFLAVGFFRPHTPYVAPKHWFNMYPLDKIQLPQVSMAERKAGPAPAYHSVHPEQDTMTDLQRKQAIQAYFASTSFVDAQLGRLLKALDRLHLSQKTIVLFQSDHGYHLGEHTLWQKQTLWDECLRVPLVVHDPRLSKAGVCDHPVELVDVYPTLTDLAGVPPGPKLDGRSLAPLIRNPKAAWTNAAFTQQRLGPGRMGHSIRTDRYHYVEWGGGGRLGNQLYDLQQDRGEHNNLASRPPAGRVLEDLRRQLRAAFAGGPD